MSRPIVVTVCMDSSSESWEPQLLPQLWHSRAGGGAVHSIKFGSPVAQLGSPLYPRTDIISRAYQVRKVPCVDGSGLARAFFTFCSIGRCSHVFGLLMRFT